MSCYEWMRGSYKIRNKTEYNKTVKAALAAFNADIVTFNEAIKRYKSRVSNRNKIDWAKFENITPSSRHYLNWDTQYLIEQHWKNRGGIPKATRKTLCIPDVTFVDGEQEVHIYVSENNRAVDTWWDLPGVKGLMEHLSTNVKWSQRGEKDGGYCTYQNEYDKHEGYGESYRHCFGRRGKDMAEWSNSRPF